MEPTLKADSVVVLDHLYQQLADAHVAAGASHDYLIRTERRLRGELAIIAAAEAYENDALMQAQLGAAVNSHADYQDAWAAARDATDQVTRVDSELAAALTRLRLREVEAIEANAAQWANFKG